MLDPEIAEILKNINALRGPGPEDVPVEQARAAHDAETEELAGFGPDVRTEDAELAGMPVRVYTPPDARGTVAYFHGGGWVVGNLRSTDAVCRALALASGATVVNVDYRLAPEHRIPRRSRTRSPSPARCDADVVAGDSAGGNLAAVVARHHRRPAGSSC